MKVRFAPSPTGKVHIGNIRAAIFNYLLARHNGGEFLIRVEDTDIERSTPEAIKALFEVMEWLNLDFDGEPFYQTSQAELHLATAEKLIAQGDAYRHAKGDTGEATIYRIPWNCDNMTGIKTVGTQTMTVHPDVPVKIDYTGISFAGVSKKGKPMESEACLAGFKDLEILDADGNVLFTLNDKIDGVLAGTDSFTVENASSFQFTRRTVGYTDLVKGELSKPLDSMKDVVIVRSNGTPIFHLSNVIDDITQQVTHIVRGDDHVENTYRHILMFQSIGGKAPEYAHLPMIVNQAGKPYSKRDGDAFVGDFKDNGFLPEALFNYLTLLGWSPGDDQEKMTRETIIKLFTLDRVNSNAAQMDMKKLTNLNAQYIAEMEPALFTEKIATLLERPVDAYLTSVCELMQIRTSLFNDCQSWGYFFSADFDYDPKASKKTIAKEAVREQLKLAKEKLAEVSEWNVENIDAAIKAAAIAQELGEFKLHQPFRIAITGVGNGAGVLEIAELLGQEQVIARLEKLFTTEF